MTYAELLAQSTAVLTPHMSTKKHITHTRFNKQSIIPIQPLRPNEIAERKEWADRQAVLLAKNKSNAVLCGGLGHE